MIAPGDVAIARPFKFANDLWETEIVQDLRERVQKQEPPNKEAALVVGSGGLPYILGLLRSGLIVYLVDLHKEVTDLSLRRVDLLQDHHSWETYEPDVADNLSGGSYANCLKEQARAAQSGLRVDFALTKAKAAEAELRPVNGDFRKLAPIIGQTAVKEGLRFTFVNATNVARELATDADPTGMLAVQQALSELPLTQDAVVVYSSPHLQPNICTPQEHAQAAAAQHQAFVT
jgi:hypothetical protein